jgi:hypothetical protein
MHAHRVEGENEVGWVLIFDGVGDSYGIPRKVMMDTQARGGMSWMSLIGLDITGRHGFGLHWFVYGWAVIVGLFWAGFQHARQKGIHSKGLFSLWQRLWTLIHWVGTCRSYFLVVMC